MDWKREQTGLRKHGGHLHHLHVFREEKCGKLAAYSWILIFYPTPKAQANG